MEAFLKTGKLGKAPPKNPETKPEDKKPKFPVPWVEKYRPRNISDVVQQEEVVAVLQKCLEGADLPNLLFYGPPGTGKTSTILAAARQLFGENYKDRILELNASDERGISVIREKVKKFSQLTANATGIMASGKACPPFKLIILDEADAMTHAAQSALRRTMEKETRSTRFCLLCNYLSRIIPPLTSRCSKFRFKPLPKNGYGPFWFITDDMHTNYDEMIRSRLHLIATEENIKYHDGVFKALIKTSDGDLRRAITCLQSCVRLKSKDHVLTAEDVNEISGVVPEKWIEKLYNACLTGNYDKVDAYVEEVSRNGFPAAKILEQFFQFTLEAQDMDDAKKAKIFLKISESNYRLMDGASEYLQLMDFGTTVMRAIA